MKRFSLVVGLVIISCASASAQRTMVGQNAVRLACLRTDSAFGAEAFFSRYTLLGYWEVGVSGRDYARMTTADVSLNYMNVAAEGDYLFRLAGSRNRALSLYGGGGVFLGYEAIDPAGNLPHNITTSLASGYFLYGIAAKLTAEVFISPRVALDFSGSVPLNFNSPLGIFHWDAGIGLKMML